MRRFPPRETPPDNSIPGQPCAKSNTPQIIQQLNNTQTTSPEISESPAARSETPLASPPAPAGISPVSPATSSFYACHRESDKVPASPRAALLAPYPHPAAFCNPF